MALCEFCGLDRTPSREHVFADWISRLLSNPEELGTAELAFFDGTSRHWRQRPFQQTVKVVCEDCNNTWMSKIDARVKPILAPMILGQSVRLRPREQKQLATWALKTAMMAEHLHPGNRVIPKADYEAISRDREPAKNNLIVVSQHLPPARSHGTLVGSFIMGQLTQLNSDGSVTQDMLDKWQTEGRSLYVVTISVGHAVFQIFGHNLPARIEVNIPDAQRAGIWPVRSHFKWPVGPALQDLEAAHRGFQGMPGQFA